MTLHHKNLMIAIGYTHTYDSIGACVRVCDVCVCIYTHIYVKPKCRAACITV